MNKEQVMGLLCCAFEGGSNYWYYDLAPVVSERRINNENGGLDDFWHLREPLTDEGVSLKDSEEEKEYILNRKTIDQGIKIFMDKYPQHYSDAINERDDAWTGDAFLQCCLFGEVIYG